MMQPLQHFFCSLAFFTRLPLPRSWLRGNMTLADLSWTFPLVGAAIGALCGLVYWALLKLGMSSLLAAWLMLGFQLLLTGGLHEGGLADTADGLASGRSRDEKHDSRIGVYGVLALIVVLSLRAYAVADFSGAAAVSALAAAGALSRAGLAPMMNWLPMAQTDGLAASAGKPSRMQVGKAILIGIVILLICESLRTDFCGLLVLIAIDVAVGIVSRRQFGGITGDVLGSAQQLGEAALLIVFITLLL